VRTETRRSNASTWVEGHVEGLIGEDAEDEEDLVELLYCKKTIQKVKKE